MVAANESGRTRLLAELFLAGPEEAGKFRDFLLSPDSVLCPGGSKAKLERARKYRDIFLPFAEVVANLKEF